VLAQGLDGLDRLLAFLDFGARQVLVARAIDASGARQVDVHLALAQRADRDDDLSLGVLFAAELRADGRLECEHRRCGFAQARTVGHFVVPVPPVFEGRIASLQGFERAIRIHVAEPE
jgi:hypothetical protein